jgi:hypothetical protein
MEWTCRCGAFAAEVEIRPGTRAVCYCNSCREFALRTGATGALDLAGGSDLYQVSPEQVTVLRGVDKLAWLRLTKKGPARWYASCCNTPVASTLTTRAIPFVTLQSHRFSDPDALGPVVVRVFRRDATARTPDGGKGAITLLLGFARNMLRSRLTGGWRRNPFFTEAGEPVGPRKDLAPSSD